ncbi:MAG TPA: NUDIX domain-containing protein [Acidimicrobiales bacterium]|nr:NUDIX domain-containing protein [Acidimicrobiales bacterium]
MSAYALCVDDGRILLTRFTSPGHPDHHKWTMPGGGMEWGESPQQTVHRELYEETGLSATLGEVAGIFSRWFTADESALGALGHLVCILFRATDLTGQLREVFDDDDTTDVAQWFPIDDVAALPHVELVDFVLQLPTVEQSKNLPRS